MASPRRDLYSGPADRVRETAKWLIVSFAAVGTILVAGSQLSSLGDLDLAGWRIWAALGGVVVALSAVVVSIEKVSQVLVLDPVSLQRLTTAPDLATIRVKLEEDRTLVPTGHLSDLYDTYLTAQRRQRETYDAFRGNPNPESLAAAKIEDGYAQTVFATAGDVLELATVWRTCRSSSGPSRRLPRCPGFAALGIVVFAAAANPPSKGQDTEPVAVIVPAAAIVDLTERGEALLRHGSVVQPIKPESHRSCRPLGWHDRRYDSERALSSAPYHIDARSRRADLSTEVAASSTTRSLGRSSSRNVVSTSSPGSRWTYVASVNAGE